MTDAVKPFLNGKFWAFFEASGEAAVVVVDGYLTVTTQKFRELFCYNEDECQGMHFRAITDPSDYDTDEKLYQSLLKGFRDHYTLVKRYVPKRGQPFDAILIVTGLQDDETGKIVAVASIIKPLRNAIGPIKSSLNPDVMESYAKAIVDYSHEIEVKTHEAKSVFGQVAEDKRPFLTRLGDWVLKLVDAIKGLNMVQAILLAFLALLTFLGVMAWFYLAQILEAVTK